MSIQNGQVDTETTATRSVDARRDESEALAVSMVAAMTDEQGLTDEPSLQLYDYIEAEAVGTLLAHSHGHDDSEWELTFSIDDVDVTVTSDGDITASE